MSKKSSTFVADFKNTKRKGIFMEKDHVKGFEQVIIDYAKENNLAPDTMMSKCQTALLNIAEWICECLGYESKEHEEFMREYAANVAAAIDRRFRKE